MDLSTYQRRYDLFVRRARALGLSDSEILAIPSVKRVVSPRSRWKTALLVAALVLCVGVVIEVQYVYHVIDLKSTFARVGVDISEIQCVVDNFEFIADMFRPYVDCSVCNITGIDRISNISQREFLRKYAYSGRPVVITDGARGWSALDKFSFEFFKELYVPDSPNLETTDRECQFFPYQTKFESLGEVFNMSEDRRDGVVGEPWYIGWSNCDSSASRVLRQHYTAPYFLTRTMESSKTDWIFMGSPGYGAHLHIDAIDRTSWQAQIKGRKEWTLEPPPECYFECPPLHSTILETGDIFVVETMKWFHKTLIVSNEMSITIGSEFG